MNVHYGMYEIEKSKIKEEENYRIYFQFSQAFFCVMDFAVVSVESVYSRE